MYEIGMYRRYRRLAGKRYTSNIFELQYESLYYDTLRFFFNTRIPQHDAKCPDRSQKLASIMWTAEHASFL